MRSRKQGKESLLDAIYIDRYLAGRRRVCIYARRVYKDRVTEMFGPSRPINNRHLLIHAVHIMCTYTDERVVCTAVSLRIKLFRKNACTEIIITIKRF